MDALKYIQKKFKVDLKQPSPIRLPIDKYRLFPALLKELGCKIGVEIGVNKGKYSKWLCHQIKGLKLFLVDPYVTYEDSGYYADQAYQDACFAEAKARVARFNCEFIRKPSMEAVKDFMDNSLDFVYIDANHQYECAVEDIAYWSKKVKKGGIVSGHDYSPYMFQVKAALDGWVKSKKIKPWFLTQHRNWFYVK